MEETYEDQLRRRQLRAELGARVEDFGFFDFLKKKSKKSAPEPKYMEGGFGEAWLKPVEDALNKGGTGPAPTTTTTTTTTVPPTTTTTVPPTTTTTKPKPKPVVVPPKPVVPTTKPSGRTPLDVSTLYAQPGGKSLGIQTSPDGLEIHLNSYPYSDGPDGPIKTAYIVSWYPQAVGQTFPAYADKAYVQGLFNNMVSGVSNPPGYAAPGTTWRPDTTPTPTPTPTSPPTTTSTTRPPTTTTTAPPTTATSYPGGAPNSGRCWVAPYTRSDGTRVKGYYKSC